MNAELVALSLYALLVLMGLSQGVLNLCGKWLPKKATARVQEADLKAWQRWNAGFNFGLSALWGALFAVRLYTGGACLAPNSPLRYLPGVFVALAVALLGMILYVYKRYSNRYF